MRLYRTALLNRFRKVVECTRNSQNKAGIASLLVVDLPKNVVIIVVAVAVVVKIILQIVF